MRGFFYNYYIKLQFSANFVINEVMFVLCLILLINDLKPTWKCALSCFLQAAGYWILTVILGELINISPINISYYSMIAVPLAIAIYLTVYSLFINRTNRAIHARAASAVVLYAVFLLSVSMSGAVGRLTQNVAANLTFYVSNFLLLQIFAYLKFFSVKRFKNIQPAGAITLYIISAAAFFLSLISRSDPFKMSSELTVAFGVSFYVVLLGAYYLFYRITREHSENIKLHIMQKRNEDEKEIMRISESNFEELKEIRHELKNQYAYMRVLIDEKRYDELDKFFKDMDDTSLPSLMYTDCGNNTVNAVVNLARKKARAENVKLETKLFIVPPKMSIRDHDLTSLMNNLIDNAIEAAAVSGSEAPIQLEAKQTGNYLFIHVINPVSPGVEESELLKLKTSKKKAGLHGYGTKIIGKIVRKYDGSVRYSVKDGLFTADVMLAAGGEIEK